MSQVITRPPSGRACAIHSAEVPAYVPISSTVVACRAKTSVSSSRPTTDPLTIDGRGSSDLARSTSDASSGGAAVVARSA